MRVLADKSHKEVSEIQKARTLLDVDLREIIRKVARKYHLSIPSKVVMADYDVKEGDLYIRFKEAFHTEGELTDDGLVVVHRDNSGIVAIEILDLGELYSHQKNLIRPNASPPVS